MLAEQRSADWFAARLGCATASAFKNVLAKLKTGKPAQARESYLIQLVTERLTGQPVPHFTTAAMQWGIDNEPAARIEYEFKTERTVEETGFIRHPSILAGASPDGLVGTDGAIEIKCPSSTTHVETLLGGMPDEHMAQVQGQLWITGRAWCDFISFDPRMPKDLQLYVERVERNDIFIANLDAEVRAFLAEVDSTVDRLITRAAA
jgi:putative phage-type endonuclease